MASASPFVFDVTAQDFTAKVLDKSREVPVVVDFWAPWCGPCRSLAPILERLVVQRNGDVLLAKVNTDEEQQLAMDYRIEALPTVVAFRDGKPILGASAAYPNLYVATGHGGYGLEVGPYSGALIADLVAGATPDLDLEPFGLDRFRS